LFITLFFSPLLQGGKSVEYEIKAPPIKSMFLQKNLFIRYIRRRDMDKIISKSLQKELNSLLKQIFN